MEAGGEVGTSGEVRMRVQRGGAEEVPSAGVAQGTEIVVRMGDGGVPRVRVVSHVAYGPDERHASGEWTVHPRELGDVSGGLQALLERHSHRAQARAFEHASRSAAAATALGEYQALGDGAEEG